MDAERVSVVIPSYNRAWSLPRAVRSVLNQTYSNFEILLVDDGSQDETPEVIENLKKSDPRIQSIRLPANSGAQRARNRGIQQAHGGWVAFLDSDDEWLPLRLETAILKAQQSKSSIVHGPCLKKNQGSSRFSPFLVPALSGWVYPALLKDPGPVFPGLLVRKRCLEKIGFLDESIVSYQEWDTTIRLAQYYPFAYLDIPLFIYHIHPYDCISRHSKREAEGWAQIVHKFEKEILCYCGSNALTTHYQKIGTKYYDAKDLSLSHDYFLKAAQRSRRVLKPLLLLQAVLAQNGVNPRLADIGKIGRKWIDALFKCRSVNTS